LTKPSSKLAPGVTLAERYHVVSKIGTGGMGSVYLAEDIKLPGKKWAVKESLRHSGDPRGFADEAEVLAKLEHPLVPKVIDFYSPDDEGYSYLIMDYVQGKTLEKLFAENGRNFAWTRVVKYAVQLCELFDYLHNLEPKPIIYRDLKPANIMIDELDNVRLIDFGIARNYSSDRSSDTVQLGTVGFAAPEQFQGLQTDARTDLYTLGACMFYLLSGGTCFGNDSASWRFIAKDIPEWLVIVIRKLLASKPEARFQSASRLKQALERGEEREAKSLPAEREAEAPALSELRSFERKIIVVGGLHTGAGATFVATALARSLHHAGVSHAYVEAGGGEPKLYSALAMRFEKGGSRPHVYMDMHLNSGKTNTAGTDARIERDHATLRWKDGMTEWVVRPAENDSDWTIEAFLLQLVSLPQPIVIVDISSCWAHDVVKELCAKAQEIIVVVDSSPAKWNVSTSRTNLELLRAMQCAGTGVSLIANRDVPMSFRGDWLASLPQEPLCTLPELPRRTMLEAEWRGRIVFDDPDVRGMIGAMLTPMMSRIVPTKVLAAERKKRSVLSKWFG